MKSKEKCKTTKRIVDAAQSYVFPGAIEKGHLRHSFASVCAAAGDSLLIIGKLLGHKDAKITARYAHLTEDHLKAASDRSSGAIAAAMAGKPSAEIIPLKQGRRSG